MVAVISPTSNPVTSSLKVIVTAKAPRHRRRRRAADGYGGGGQVGGDGEGGAGLIAVAGSVLGGVSGDLDVTSPSSAGVMVAV